MEVIVSIVAILISVVIGGLAIWQAREHAHKAELHLMQTKEIVESISKSQDAHVQRLTEIVQQTIPDRDSQMGLELFSTLMKSNPDMAGDLLRQVLNNQQN